MKQERFRLTPAVYLVVMKGNEVLLARRYNTGFHDGEYSLPAGHLDGDETLIRALQREAKEELGIEVAREDLSLVHVMHRKELAEPIGERISFFFRARAWKEEPEILEPHRCDDLRWFPLRQLPQNLIPYVRQALDCISREDLYSEYGW